MKTWFPISACVVLLISAVVLVAFHSQFHRSRPSVAQSPATTLLTAARLPSPPPVEAVAAPDLSLSTVPEAPIPPTPSVADPGAKHISSETVVPVHVVRRQNTVHPGIAYDFYNDAGQPLNLLITVANPLRMPKVFNCHLEPGRGSYCELGFDQGFSGSLGDTLTIEMAGYLPLQYTP